MESLFCLPIDRDRLLQGHRVKIKSESLHEETGVPADQRAGQGGR
jgi:hypothetical protein